MHTRSKQIQDPNQVGPRTATGSGPVISRRRVLAAGTTGFAAALLAACGEEESGPATRLPAPPTASHETVQAQAVSATVTEAAPRDTRGIPAPGAMGAVNVAFTAPTWSVWGFGIEPMLLSAGLAASAASARRYTYEGSTITDHFKSDYSLSAQLESLPGGADLVMFHAHDLPDLLEAEQLLPLDDHLQSDRDFDRAAYWPGTLETGLHEGVQYTLPVAVAPWSIVFNRDLAKESGIEMPERQGFDRAAFLQAGLAMQGGPSIEGREHGLGFLLQVDPRPGPGGDYASWPPAYVFLQAALGDLRGANGTFEALRSAEALEITQFFHDMAHTYKFAPKPERSGDRVWITYTEGSIGMFGESLQGPGYGWLRSGPFANQVLLPFPSFGAVDNPADIWTMIGISAQTEEPKMAYDALRALERQLRNVAFVPAAKSTPEQLRAIAPALLDEELQMLVDLMASASYIRLSRRERGVLTNAIDAGVVLEGVSAQEALLDAATSLERLADR